MSFLRKIIMVFCSLLLAYFLALILSGVLIYKAEFDIVRFGDTSVLLQQNIGYFLIDLAITILILIILWWTIGKIKPKSIWKLASILLFLNVVFQFLVIYYFREQLTADWAVIYNIGKELLGGNMAPLLKEGYLYAYPHNLGLTLYFMLFDIITANNVYLLRALNVLYSLITLIFINKIFINLYPEYTKEQHRFLIFSVFFLPAIFMSNLVYNEVISTMFFTTAIYSSIRFIKTQKMKYLLSAIILLSFGQFMRSIGYLFAAAIIIYFFLMKVNWKYLVFFFLSLFIGFTSPLLIINYDLLSAGKIQEPLGKNSIPIIKWLNMGFNNKYFGYWDQGESYWMYARDAKWNKNEAAKLYVTSIENKITDYGPEEIANLYYKKLVWLWSEGTYQSIYLGMGHTNPGGYLKITPVSKYFEENLTRREIFKTPMYFINIVSLITIFIFITYVLITRKWQLIEKEMLFVLIILFFMFFYLLWETKPRYIYPIYPYLLLLSYISVIKLNKLKA
jgi:hypothetical protein